MPFVSVVVPNYNHGSFLKDRIQSVLNQTFDDYEVILLDDASTDNSMDVLEAYRHHEKISHLVRNTTNSGSPFRQWVKGASMASGEWLWIAEADDVASHEFLTSMMALQRQHPAASLLFCNSTIVGTHTPHKTTADLTNSFFKTQKWSEPYAQDGRAEINQCLKTINTICNASAVLVKKDALLQIADHLGTFRYYGDWAAYLRILERHSVAYTPRLLNAYRRSEGSLLQSNPTSFQTAKESFSILRWLLKQDFVTGKNELIQFFVKVHVGFGVRRHGLGQALKKMAFYCRKDFRLAMLLLAHSVAAKRPRR